MRKLRSMLEFIGKNQPCSLKQVTDSGHSATMLMNEVKLGTVRRVIKRRGNEIEMYSLK